MGEMRLPMPDRVSPLREATWMANGHCRKSQLEPDTWFPITADDANAKMAKTICGWCPVRETCLAEALAIPGTHGIWGGTDEEDRRRMRIREGRRRVKELARG